MLQNGASTPMDTEPDQNLSTKESNSLLPPHLPLVAKKEEEACLVSLKVMLPLMLMHTMKIEAPAQPHLVQPLHKLQNNMFPWIIVVESCPVATQISTHLALPTLASHGSHAPNL